MDEQKDKTTEGIAEAIVEATSTIKVGDVIVSSSTTTIDGLCSVLDWLFKHKEINKYLDLVKAKKNATSYVG